MAIPEAEGGQEETGENAPHLATIHCTVCRIDPQLLSAFCVALPHHPHYGAAEIIIQGPDDTDDDLMLDASSSTSDDYYIIGLVNDWKERDAARFEAVIRHFVSCLDLDLVPDANPVPGVAA